MSAAPLAPSRFASGAPASSSAPTQQAAAGKHHASQQQQQPQPPFLHNAHLLYGQASLPGSRYGILNQDYVEAQQLHDSKHLRQHRWPQCYAAVVLVSPPCRRAAPHSGRRSSDRLAATVRSASIEPALPAHSCRRFAGRPRHAWGAGSKGGGAPHHRRPAAQRPAPPAAGRCGACLPARLPACLAPAASPAAASLPCTPAIPATCGPAWPLHTDMSRSEVEQVVRAAFLAGHLAALCVFDDAPPTYIYPLGSRCGSRAGMAAGQRRHLGQRGERLTPPDASAGCSSGTPCTARTTETK